MSILTDCGYARFVAKVPVPFTFTFPAIKALPKLLDPLKVVDPRVVVAAVKVARLVLPVAINVPVEVRFVLAKLLVVAFVPVAFVQVIFVNAAERAERIAAKKFVDVLFEIEAFVENS